MSEMVDRVAKALCGHGEPACWETHRTEARRAIEAMRIENPVYYVNGLPNVSLKDSFWNERIDAALADSAEMKTKEARTIAAMRGA